MRKTVCFCRRFFVGVIVCKKEGILPLTSTPDGCILKIPHGGILQNEVHEMEENKACPCCCQKTTKRSDAQKKSLLNRLRRIEGQVRGIQTMLEQDAYCNDVLIQSAAVNAAMNAFNRELLASHIRGCVVRDIRAGQDEVIDELVATLQKLMK